MISQDKREIALIPRGLPRSPQNEYRMAFWDVRENSLGSRPQVGSSLQDVGTFTLNLVRQRHPSFSPSEGHSQP
jgi:hypothetical protein